MCRGITVFSALSQYNVKSTDRVGIVGIGGLGHLAILFAVKMGCELVVFSRTEEKRSEALSLGATSFYATKNLAELKLDKELDHLLICTSGQPEYKLYVISFYCVLLIHNFN
jgi:D-arabinose 1-dehydrogenase-like Zn-dependent alcohol dehydrogenase